MNPTKNYAQKAVEKFLMLLVSAEHNALRLVVAEDRRTGKNVLVVCLVVPGRGVHPLAVVPTAADVAALEPDLDRPGFNVDQYDPLVQDTVSALSHGYSGPEDLLQFFDGTPVRMPPNIDGAQIARLLMEGA